MAPNIIMITWHDAGRWFGCYGAETVHTPNVDALAAAGARFANTTSACAICSPSRAAIATGRYCQANGVMTLANNAMMNRLHVTETHLCRRLKEQHGFRTALFGVEHEVAHEHVTEIMNPDERFCTDPWRDAEHTAAAAEKWLRERADDTQPFYAQIGLLEAHLGRYYAGNRALPRDTEHGLAVPPYLEDTPEARDVVATLQGLLRRGDEAIGRILAALEESGRDRDTIVMMCVDHGVGLPRAKTTCYDGGTGVAWIIRYPGTIPAGTVVESMTAHVDVLPTLLDLAGLAVPDSVHGMSFAAHARGESNEDLRDAAFSHMVENIRSIRTRTHKFIRNFRRPRRGTYKGNDAVRPASALTVFEEAPHVELYDLAADPGETRNLAGDPAHAEVQARLDARLWNFLLDQDDFVVNEPVAGEWQAESRRQLLAHCAATGRATPVIDG